MTTDLWTEATRDFERERLDHRTASARIALGEFTAYLHSAESTEDHENRLALIDEQIRTAVQLAVGDDVGSFPLVHESVMVGLQADFDVLHQHRQAQAQKRNARRAYERNQARTAAAFDRAWEADDFPIIDDDGYYHTLLGWIVPKALKGTYHDGVKFLRHRTDLPSGWYRVFPKEHGGRQFAGPYESEQAANADDDVLPSDKIVQVGYRRRASKATEYKDFGGVFYWWHQEIIDELARWQPQGVEMLASNTRSPVGSDTKKWVGQLLEMGLVESAPTPSGMTGDFVKLTAEGEKVAKRDWSWHPDSPAYKGASRRTGSMNWTGVGGEFDRAAVGRAIEGLRWIDPSSSVPMAPGLAIKKAIEEFRIPKVSQIAWESNSGVPGIDGPYDLLGIEGNYRNGRVRVYIVDKGTVLIPVASHVIDAMSPLASRRTAGGEYVLLTNEGDRDFGNIYRFDDSGATEVARGSLDEMKQRWSEFLLDHGVSPANFDPDKTRAVGLLADKGYYSAMHIGGYGGVYIRTADRSKVASSSDPISAEARALRSGMASVEVAWDKTSAHSTTCPQCGNQLGEEDVVVTPGPDGGTRPSDGATLWANCKACHWTGTKSTHSRPLARRRVAAAEWTQDGNDYWRASAGPYTATVEARQGGFKWTISENGAVLDSQIEGSLEEAQSAAMAIMRHSASRTAASPHFWRPGDPTPDPNSDYTPEELAEFGIGPWSPDNPHGYAYNPDWGGDPRDGMPVEEDPYTWRANIPADQREGRRRTAGENPFPPKKEEGGDPADPAASDDPSTMEAGAPVTISYTLTGEKSDAGDVEGTFESFDGTTAYFTYEKGKFGVTLQNGKWVDSAGTVFTFAGGTAPVEEEADPTNKVEVDTTKRPVAASRRQRTAASQAEFDADMEKLNQALAPYVIDFGDGTKGIRPDAPADLRDAYSRLMQYGYANGLMGSYARRRTANIPAGTFVLEAPDGEQFSSAEGFRSPAEAARWAYDSLLDWTEMGIDRLDIVDSQGWKVTSVDVRDWSDISTFAGRTAPASRHPFGRTAGGGIWPQRHTFQCINGRHDECSGQFEDGECNCRCHGVEVRHAALDLGVPSISNEKGRQASVPEILAQIGTMTLMSLGAREYVDLGDGVHFRVGAGNPLRKVIIKLNLRDYYDVEIGRMDRKTFDWTVEYQARDIDPERMGDILRTALGRVIEGAYSGDDSPYGVGSNNPYVPDEQIPDAELGTPDDMLDGPAPIKPQTTKPRTRPGGAPANGSSSEQPLGTGTSAG